MAKFRFSWFLILLVSIQLLTGCTENTIADINMDIDKRNWTYVNTVKTVVDIKDPSSRHDIYFKLRHTADYRYSNIYILFHLKAGGKTVTRRYEYSLAHADGQWKGAGSGNLYSYRLPLLTNYRFGTAGKYELEIEQNMRDNPLREVSDVGISVSKALE